MPDRTNLGLNRITGFVYLISAFSIIRYTSGRGNYNCSGTGLSRTSPGLKQHDWKLQADCSVCQFVGACNRTGSTVRCECYDQYYVQKSPKQCTRKEYCQAGLCQNEGTCVNTWGHYYCQCKNGFHGPNCIVKGTTSWIKLVKVLFEVEAWTAKRTYHYIIVDGAWSNAPFKMTYSPGEGMTFVAVHQPSEISQSPWAMADAKKYADKHTKDLFPKKQGMRYFVLPNYYSLQNKETEMSLKIEIGGFVEYEAKFWLYVKKRSRICQPEIQLKHCSRMLEDHPKYRRSLDFSILSEHIPDPYCAEKQTTISHKWELFTITDDKWFPAESELDHGQDQNMKTLESTSAVLKFKAFSMDTNLYMLRLKVTETVPDKPQESGWNFAQCAFRVILGPLIILLLGGPVVVIGIDSPFITGLTECLDPSQPSCNYKEMRFSWSCWAQEPKEPEVFCQGEDKIIGEEKMLLVPQKSLTSSDSYTFKVDVVQRSRKITLTQKVKVFPGRRPLFNIRCVYNCGLGFKSNPTEVVSLLAECLSSCSKEMMYKWKVYGPAGEVVAVDSVRQPGTRPERLILPANNLTENFAYTIMVVGAVPPFRFTGQASYTLKMNAGPEAGTCTIKPTFGCASVTHFDINCRDFKDEDDAMNYMKHYEYFQKTNLSEPGLGILVSHETDPWTHEILLIQGLPENNYMTEISVKMSDPYGMSVVYKHPTRVEVKEIKQAFENSNDTLALVENMMTGGGKMDISDVCGDRKSNQFVSVGKLMARGDVSNAVGIVASLAEIIANVTVDPNDLDSVNKEKQLKADFIDTLNQIPVNTLPRALQVSTAIRKVVVSGKVPDLSPITTKLTASVLQKIGDQLLEEVRHPYIQKRISTQEVEDLVNSVLVVSATLMSDTLRQQQEKEAEPTPPPTPLDAQYPEYFSMEEENADRAENLEIAAGDMVGAMAVVGKAITYHMTQEQAPTTLEHEIAMWVKVDSPTRLSENLTGIGIVGTGVSISGSLADALEAKYPFIDLEVTTMHHNPFLWHDSQADMNTKMLMVSLRDVESKQDVVLAEPLDLFVNVTPGTLKMKVEDGCVVVRKVPTDDDIAVHRTMLKKGASVYVTFMPLVDNAKLQVVITVEKRPEIADFEARATTVPNEMDGSSSAMSTESAPFDDTWAYLGVLPHSDMVKEAATTGTETKVNYTFAMNSASCHHWSAAAATWVTDGCSVGSKTGPTRLHCRCLHTSLFGGSFLVAPNKLDMFTGVQLSLAMYDNPVIVAFMVSVLLVYLLGMILAHRKDKHDVVKRGIIVLEDNVPGDKYAYLVAVFTGQRLNSGTTSHVGFQIVGNKFQSKPHILSNPGKKVLQRSADDWFLMLSKRNLGELLAIRLWHDNSGRNPAWYCSKVIVRDLQTNEVWTFLVSRWLSVVHGNGRIYCIVMAATSEELTKWKLLLTDNTALSLREDHIWLSIFTRHPRSNFTCCQRLSIAMSILTTTMLAHILFYGVPKTPGQQIDAGTFAVTLREVMIALEAAVITFPINLLIMLLFRKTEPYAVSRERENEIEPATTQKDLELLDQARLSRDSRFSGGDQGGLGRQDTLDRLMSWKADNSKDARSKAVRGSKSQKGAERTRKERVSQAFESFLLMDGFVLTGSETDGDIPLEDDSASLDEHRKTVIAKVDVANTVQRPSYWFPSWVIYFAWLVCISTILVAAFFILWFGLSFGRVKSFMWLSSITIALVQSIFLMQPLKIIAFALLLTFLFRTQAKTVDFDANASEAVVRFNTDLEENAPKAYQDVLKYRRSRRMYRPVPQSVVPVLRSTELLNMELAELLRDLLMFLTYTMILYWLAIGTRDPLAYHSTRAIEEMVVDGIYNQDVPFTNFNSDKEFIEYLNSTLIPALHAVEWYNGDPVVDPGSTEDPSVFLVGVARLRQIRIHNNTCSIPKMFRGNFTQCYDAYSYLNEDQGSYNIGWHPFLKLQYQPTRAKLPWVYQPPWVTASIPHIGDMGVYHGGGFVSNLGRTRTNSRLTLSYLVNRNWLDAHTRAVFIEFTTYNINRNLFNIVNLLAERSPVGVYTASYEIQTVKLLFRAGDLDTSVIVAFVLFLVMLSVFMVRLGLRVRQEGVRAYMSSLWNVIDLVIFALSLTSLALYFERTFYVTRLLKALAEADNNEYVSFFAAMYADIVLTYIIAFLVCFTTARLWKILRFGHNFRMFEMMLVQAKGTLLSFTLLAGLLLLGFAIFMYLFMSDKANEFHNISYSVSTLLSAGLGFSSYSSNLLVLGFGPFGQLIDFVYSFLLNVNFLNMFITILMIYYAKSQVGLKLGKHVYNLYDYVTDEVNYILHQYGFKKMRATKKQPNPSSTPQQATSPKTNAKRLSSRGRLRGGTDSAAPPSAVVLKPEELAYNNTVEVSKTRMQAMRHAAVANSRQPQDRQAAMKAVMRGALVKDDDDDDDNERYFVGMVGNERVLVPEDRLEEMEYVVNLAAEKRHARQQQRRGLLDSIEEEVDIVEVETKMKLTERFNIKCDYLAELIKQLVRKEPVGDPVEDAQVAVHDEGLLAEVERVESPPHMSYCGFHPYVHEQTPKPLPADKVKRHVRAPKREPSPPPMMEMCNLVPQKEFEVSPPTRHRRHRAKKRDAASESRGRSTSKLISGCGLNVQKAAAKLQPKDHKDKTRGQAANIAQTQFLRPHRPSAVEPHTPDSSETQSTSSVDSADAWSTSEDQRSYNMALSLHRAHLPQNYPGVSYERTQHRSQLPHYELREQDSNTSRSGSSAEHSMISSDTHTQPSWRTMQPRQNVDQRTSKVSQKPQSHAVQFLTMDQQQEYLSTSNKAAQSWYLPADHTEWNIANGHAAATWDEILASTKETHADPTHYKQMPLPGTSRGLPSSHMSAESRQEHCLAPFHAGASSSPAREPGFDHASSFNGINIIFEQSNLLMESESAIRLGAASSSSGSSEPATKMCRLKATTQREQNEDVGHCTVGPPAPTVLRLTPGSGTISGQEFDHSVTSCELTIWNKLPTRLPHDTHKRNLMRRADARIRPPDSVNLMFSVPPASAASENQTLASSSGRPIAGCSTEDWGTFVNTRNLCQDCKEMVVIYESSNLRSQPPHTSHKKTADELPKSSRTGQDTYPVRRTAATEAAEDCSPSEKLVYASSCEDLSSSDSSQAQFSLPSRTDAFCSLTRGLDSDRPACRDGVKVLFQKSGELLATESEAMLGPVSSSGSSSSRAE